MLLGLPFINRTGHFRSSRCNCIKIHCRWVSCIVFFLYYFSLSFLTFYPITLRYLLSARIYRWSINLADTDFFQLSVSLSAADFRGWNYRPSAKHFFIKFYVHTLALSLNVRSNLQCQSVHMNFGILCAHFGTVTQCSVEPTVPKCAHKIPKFIKNSA